VNVSWLDVKLGMRMVAKYPWLSGVSVIGMAVAIAIGAAYFSIIGVVLDSTLPVDDGDRVVAIETKTIAGPEAGHRDGVSPHDFVQWRSELKSITDLGAFIDERRNLITTDARTEPAPNVVAMLSAMQDPKHPDFILDLKDLIDRNEWERRETSSSRRASAAIAPIHPSGDVIVLEHSTFACGGAPLLDLAAEPLVMVDRAGQQVERHLGPPCGQSPRRAASASLRVRGEPAGS
jgi:hypothetical protein